ncbi:MOSC domain-containing protein [Trichostrongylus colubriformis]|uniref:MOSC domain-containing protein n=1 Tax=Trichostrongylus colubriformis TaxID=6319 RepID=A0AAN8FUQ2_TRICO
MILEDKKQLIGIAGASILTYGVVTHLFSYLRSRSNPFVPVGTVKELYVYPIKSCKGISVFSFYCHELGPVSGEHYDRRFIVVDGKTGRFYTARQKPVMVTIECEIRDGILTVTASDGRSVQVDLAEVSRNKVVKTAFLHFNLRTDGLDCGDKAAEFFSKAIDEPDTRLLMYTEGLHTERTCVTHPDWWNNNVPKRKDNCAYADLAPYMITTQASLDDLNSKLQNDVSTLIPSFRNKLRDKVNMLARTGTTLWMGKGSTSHDVDRGPRCAALSPGFVEASIAADVKENMVFRVLDKLTKIGPIKAIIEG